MLIDFEIAAVADADKQRAAIAGGRISDSDAFSVAEFLDEPEIEIILNLTIPKAHAEVGLAALKAGKSAYNEKPLAIARGCARDARLGARERT